MTDPRAYHTLNRSERDHLLGVHILDGFGSGSSIRRTVESLRDDDVHNAVTYRSLDSLIEYGLVRKWERDVDGRTNSYVLTDDGRETIESGMAAFKRRDDGDGSDD
jgi:DNA-binding PadR family transcriptional regulator